jgi:hypothetical protein
LVLRHGERSCSLWPKLRRLIHSNSLYDFGMGDGKRGQGSVIL